ncbi:hypothetical protein K0817_006665 [Microbacterium sp. HD4P20]|uniref:hypothetical protein n=1 Tax=Microbacterium sp. HD4P20 TaxID=2864874 RepID=UPI001C6410C6|nr:hypothetical protein [Microbacterium sp. HD4P20]MCP2636251.1 hypothetical protein [Microbacterium sp. HD4P20]
MTSTLRAMAAAAASVALVFTLAACAGGGDEPTSTPTASGEASASITTQTACDGDEGVTLVVDATALEGGEPQEQCLLTEEAVVAGEAFTIAGVETEGTEEYGDQVVCRVEGLPAEDEAIAAEDGSDYFETCQAMPAAFAYWSVWVRTAGGEWGYAQEGLSTLQVEPGDAVGLLFTLHGEPAAPTS